MTTRYMLVAVFESEKFPIDVYDTKKEAEQEMHMEQLRIDNDEYGEDGHGTTLIIDEIDVPEITL